MAIEIVDFPIKNGGSFHGKMLVHQRVTMFTNCPMIFPMKSRQFLYLPLCPIRVWWSLGVQTPQRAGNVLATQRCGYIRGIACIGHIIEKIIRLIMGYLIYIYIYMYIYICMYIYIYICICRYPALSSYVRDIPQCVWQCGMPEIHGHFMKKIMIIEGTPCSDKAISNGFWCLELPGASI